VPPIRDGWKCLSHRIHAANEAPTDNDDEGAFKPKPGGQPMTIRFGSESTGLINGLFVAGVLLVQTVCGGEE
jgi:hypothetical protein